MNDTLKKIALVIPVHNRRETTLQGLRSLSRIDKTGLQLRIIVVDDGSTDGTSEMIRTEFPDVMLIAGTGNLHYAAGTNRGIESSLAWDPDYVVLMNDDSVFHEQFLQRMIATADSNPHSVIGALLLVWNEPHKVFQVGQTWHTAKGGWVIPDELTAFSVPQEPFAVECLVGNCVLVPTEAIRECGVLDEIRFPHGWGDAQYMMRLRKAGWNLLVDPKAFVWCEPNTYPAPLHSLKFTKIIDILLKNERHPMNLKRQFVARWESAPDKSRAFIAFLVHCSQLFYRGFLNHSKTNQ